MVQKTQMVTIPLDEYKELLLKDKAAGSERAVMFERIVTTLKESLEYSSSSYSTVAKNVDVKDGRELTKEILNIIKYTDFDLYMSIWNAVMTQHRKEEEEKLKIEQMNQAKEIRQLQKENN